jgi:SAM-dependent methyltransferase
MSRSQFYEATQGLPPVPTLVTALAAWQSRPGHAIDLGCGAGRDTLELLRCGWYVQAVDMEQQALQRIIDQTPADHRDRLCTRCERFEDLQLPPAQLINSSFALPFCSPVAFPALWQSISASLEGGGLFAGHFFGEADDWASHGLTIHSRQAIEAQFCGWRIISLEETDREGLTAKGTMKHWHIFSVVARRP